MEANDFCYWLQGFFEMSGAKALDEKQVEMLKKHLGLVMVNVTGCDKPEVLKKRPGVSFPSSLDRKIC
jgi:hypothetical protein